MRHLPEVGLLRLSDIIGDPRANPPKPPIIPVSKTTWYEGVKAGRFPRPVLLTANTRGYRVKDILALIEQDRPPSDGGKPPSLRTERMSRRSRQRVEE